MASLRPVIMPTSPTTIQLEKIVFCKSVLLSVNLGFPPLWTFLVWLVTEHMTCGLQCGEAEGCWSGERSCQLINQPGLSPVTDKRLRGRLQTALLSFSSQYESLCWCLPRASEFKLQHSALEPLFDWRTFSWWWRVWVWRLLAGLAFGNISRKSVSR